MGDKKRREELALERISQEIETGGIDVHRNVLNQPYITFKIEDRPKGCFYLYDPAAEEWLANFLWDNAKLLLRGWEMKPILKELAGRSMKTVRKAVEEPALLHVLQTEPVVAVIYEFMDSQKTDTLEKKAKRLWEELWTFAETRGLLKLGRKRFPGGSNVFTRVLKRFIPVLAALGVDVELKDRSDGRPVVVKRLVVDSGIQPSVESSSPKSGTGKEMASTDDQSMLLEKLREKQNHTPDKRSKS